MSIHILLRRLLLDFPYRLSELVKLSLVLGHSLPNDIVPDKVHLFNLNLLQQLSCIIQSKLILLEHGRWVFILDDALEKGYTVCEVLLIRG